MTSSITSPEHTQSIKNDSVPIGDIYTVSDVAYMLKVSKNRIYEMAKYLDDPLPVRIIEGTKKGSFLLRDEFIAWLKRNCGLMRDGR